MTIEIVMVLIVAACGVSAFILALFCWRDLRKKSDLLEFVYQEVANLEDCLKAQALSTKEIVFKSNDQSRRIAWLESRIRRPEKHRRNQVSEEVVSVSGKANITERRHRVLELAGTGQASDAIASALGMLNGEVELILNLNRIQVNQN